MSLDGSFFWFDIVEQARTHAGLMIMSFDADRVRRPFGAPPIPDVLCSWIGKLAVTWSLIELQLDQLIGALLKASQTSGQDGWERLNFKKRKKLCRDLSKTFFAGAPSVISTLSSILGDAADLHWRRNLILHGPLSVTLRVTQELDIEAILSAYSRRDDTTLTLTTTGVEDLFLRLGMYPGALINS